MITPETITLAKTLSENVLVLLVFELLVLGSFIVLMIRYMINSFAKMSDEQNKTLIEVTKVVTRNTVALDNNAAIITQNEKILSETKIENAASRQRRTLEQFVPPGDKRHESP